MTYKHNPKCWTCQDSGKYYTLKGNLLPCIRCSNTDDSYRKEIPAHNGGDFCRLSWMRLLRKDVTGELYLLIPVNNDEYAAILKAV